MTREESLVKVRGYLTDLLPIEDYDEVEEIMSALEQEPKWISVSERLPKEDKQVLVTECFTTISEEKIYSISLANFYGDDWVTVHDEYKIDPSRHKVIAWRELPETYKAESEEV